MDDQIPTYAILSHRWQDGEVSLQDMQCGAAHSKPGHSKIAHFCDLARENGLLYAWADTCCIDKTSSAELSEAINSMYRWYQNSAVCYVYLYDVRKTDEGAGFEAWYETFRNSAWWTRGWTLQELLASPCVDFHDATWTYLGNKTILTTEIVAITGINAAMLGGAQPDTFSIAQRMSWAARRTTTRVEDAAYSLLGLFGVNMPMLYGEGERAFARLQEEIMKSSDDHSLFAWSGDVGEQEGRSGEREQGQERGRGLLARSPRDFGGCNHVVPADARLNKSPYAVTNLGLSIELPMVGWAMDTYLAALDCKIETSANSRRGIFLRLLPDSQDQCTRVSVDGKDIQRFDESLVSQSRFRKVYVRQKQVGSMMFPVQEIYGFWLRKFPLRTGPAGSVHFLREVHSRIPWDGEKTVIEIPKGQQGTAGVLWYESRDGFSFLKLGFDAMYNPVCEFGGTAWGSTLRLYYPEDEIKSQMDNSWILARDHPHTWYYVGDRLTGLAKSDEMHRITITRGHFEFRNVWVVNIESIDRDAFREMEYGSREAVAEMKFLQSG